LSKREFWHLTLAQLDALIKRYNDAQEWLNFRAGLICAVIANAHRDPKKGKAFTPKDFMPKKEVKQKPTKLTGEQMLERAKMITISFDGEIK